jgi:hypothetical protein
MRTCVVAKVYIYIYTYIQTYHAYIRTYIVQYIHTYIHTYTHIKAHVGIVGNELADRLAKAAASDSDANIVFNRLPMSTLISKIQKETKLKWQKEWEDCTKAKITKEFFLRVHDRQKLEIDITPILTAMMTGHGKTRTYLHRFKFLEHANCPCGNGDQKIEHILN